MIYKHLVALTVYRFFVLAVSIFFPLTMLAKETVDTAHIAIYHRYYQLFDSDSTEEFYDVSKRLQQNYIKKDKIESYYKIRQNEIFYDAAHGRTYQAIKKANELLEEMKTSKTKHYELAYMSLASIFETRGAYRVALYYYQKALDNINPNDSTGLAHIYAQLAVVNLTRKLDEARQWGERLGHIISSDSLYYRSYLTLKGQFYFFNGEREEFFKAKQEFEDFLKRTTALDHNGEQILTIMENATVGKYDEALRLLSQESQDYDDIKRCDIRIRIYEMMGRTDLAVKEANERRDLRDSLGSDLLFNNLNEINTAIGVAKLNEEASKDRELRLGTIIILLFIALGLTISRYISRQRHQKEIEEHNQQLEIAIAEAKESDRIKDVFIKHISHEIRTPLNIITGNLQVIDNSAFDLGEDERNKMIQAIGQNSIAMTNIVNDLMELSQADSKERYRKDDRIVVNDFCRHIIEEVEERNKGRLELSFQTMLPDDFTIQSNQNGVERILLQLLNNALKFTEQGYVELSVDTSHDSSDIRFAVTDTGIGIPEDLHEQVFEHFYKLDSFKQGLGIGLSISRKIASLLGGTLAIDKEYHCGTRVILTIPDNYHI